MHVHVPLHPPRRQWSSKLSVFRFLNFWFSFFSLPSSTTNIHLSLRCYINLPSVRDSVVGFLCGRVCLGCSEVLLSESSKLSTLHRKHFLILLPACLLNFPPGSSQILSFSKSSFLLLTCVACEIQFPGQGSKPACPRSGKCSLSHWAVRGSPPDPLLNWASLVSVHTGLPSPTVLLISAIPECSSLTSLYPK